MLMMARQVANNFMFLQENEVPGCWVPILDQTSMPATRDPNLAVMPVTYQPAPFAGSALYQSPQVVYSTEQYSNQPTVTSQVAQYPVGYPMTTYTYPGELHLRQTVQVAG